jgi:hypothetical protein
MVLLTMTSSMVEALEKLQSLQDKTGGNDDVQSKESNRRSGGHDQDQQTPENQSVAAEKREKQLSELSLLNPKVGNPISHGQIIDISRDLVALRILPNNLEALLRGSKVYVPPPPPKAEPVSDTWHSEYR